MSGNDLPAKSTSVSTTVITQMIRPQHTDDRGYCLGGEILAWIDIAAGVTAKRHADLPTVTASMDAVHFLSPIMIGDMCILYATVNRSWRTSMEIGVLVEAENMQTGDRRYCCHAFLTFVALKDGKSYPVPALLPETEEERLNYENAQARREARFQSKETSAAIMISSHMTPKCISYSPTVSMISLDMELPRTKSASASYVELTEIIFPQHANSLGITFGGQIMKWMEYVAIMSASRFCRSHLLSCGMDSINFLRPTKVGDIVIIKGIVSETFNHSIEVYVTVETEHASTERVLTNDGWLTIVSVDKEGSLKKVCELNAEEEDQIARKKGAKARRNERLKQKNMLVE